MNIEENRNDKGRDWKAPKKDIEELAMGSEEDEEDIDLADKAPYQNLNLAGQLKYRGEQAGSESVAEGLAEKKKLKLAEKTVEKPAAPTEDELKQQQREKGIREQVKAQERGRELMISKIKAGMDAETLREGITDQLADLEDNLSDLENDPDQDLTFTRQLTKKEELLSSLKTLDEIAAKKLPLAA